jgi:hypothetical protein
MPADSAEELYEMEMLAPSAPPLVVRQAQALLRAWVCGETPRLEAELNRSVFISLPGEGDRHDEHMALLKSIAFQMKSCQNLFAERTSDPQLGLCIDLLMHLASCLPTPAESDEMRRIPPMNRYSPGIPRLTRAGRA